MYGVFDRYVRVVDWIFAWVFVRYAALPKMQRLAIFLVVLLAVMVRGALLGAQAQVQIFAPLTSALTVPSSWMTGSLNLAALISYSLGFLGAVYAMVKEIPSRSIVVIATAGSRFLAAFVIPAGIVTLIVPAIFNGTAGCIGAGTFGNAGVIPCFAAPIAQAITGVSTVQTPDVILGEFSKLAWQFPTSAWSLLQNGHFNILTNPGPLLLAVLLLAICIIIAIVIIGVGAIIAIDVFLAGVFAQFAMPLVLWSIGFIVLPVTAGLGSGNFSALMKIIARYVVVCAIAACVTVITTSWTSQVSTATASFGLPGATVNIGLLKLSIEFLMGVIMLGVVAKEIPKVVEGALAGVPAFSGGGAAGAAAEAGKAAVSAANEGARGAAFGAFLGGKADSAQEAALGGFARGGVVGAAAAVASYAAKNFGGDEGGGAGDSGGGGSNPIPPSPKDRSGPGPDIDGEFSTPPEPIGGGSPPALGGGGGGGGGGDPGSPGPSGGDSGGGNGGGPLALGGGDGGGGDRGGDDSSGGDRGPAAPSGGTPRAGGGGAGGSASRGADRGGDSSPRGNSTSGDGSVGDGVAGESPAVDLGDGATLETPQAAQSAPSPRRVTSSFVARQRAAAASKRGNKVVSDDA